MSAIKGQLEEENGRDIVDELAGSAAHSIAVLSEVEAALTLRATTGSEQVQQNEVHGAQCFI
ncbi:MAG TPA: hypothetical protein VIH63_07765 [Xanthobacteraceae bacterium]